MFTFPLLLSFSSFFFYIYFPFLCVISLSFVFCFLYYWTLVLESFLYLALKEWYLLLWCDIEAGMMLEMVLGLDLSNLSIWSRDLFQCLLLDDIYLLTLLSLSCISRNFFVFGENLMKLMPDIFIMITKKEILINARWPCVCLCSSSLSHPVTSSNALLIFVYLNFPMP